MKTRPSLQCHQGSKYGGLRLNVKYKWPIPPPPPHYVCDLNQVNWRPWRDKYVTDEEGVLNWYYDSKIHTIQSECEKMSHYTEVNMWNLWRHTILKSICGICDVTLYWSQYVEFVTSHYTELSMWNLWRHTILNSIYGICDVTLYWTQFMTFVTSHYTELNIWNLWRHTLLISRYGICDVTIFWAGHFMLYLWRHTIGLMSTSFYLATSTCNYELYQSLSGPEYLSTLLCTCVCHTCMCVRHVVCTSGADDIYTNDIHSHGRYGRVNSR